MKSVKPLFSVIAVILVLAAGCICIRPVTVRISSALQEKKEQVLRQIEEMTGLSASAGTFSPSILSSLRLSRIALSDVKTGETVVSVKKIVFRYNILKLLALDFEHAFNGLILDGITVDYDASQDSAVAAKITALLQGSEPQAEELPPAESGDSADDAAPESRTFSLPFPVTLKKVSVSYRTVHYTAKVTLDSLRIQPVQDSGGTADPYSGGSSVMYADAAGRFSFTPHNGFLSAAGDAFCNFSLKTVLTPQLEGSSAQIAVEYLENKDFTVVPFGIDATYHGKQLVCRLAAGNIPFETECVIAPENGRLRISMEADRFYPFSFVAVKNRRHPANMIHNSFISGSYSVVLEKDAAGNPHVQYAADGALNFPGRKKIPRLQFSYAVSGTEQTVQIDTLAVDSDLYKASYHGSFDIPKLQPQGTLSIDSVQLPNGNSLQTAIYLDPLDTGFMGFVPELDFGTQKLTALQFEIIPDNTSVDYSLEVSDYSHPEADIPGKILFTGSFLPGGKEPFIQLRTELQNIFLDTCVKTAAFFAGSEKAESLANAAARLSPYVMIGELYASSDFKTITYNIPYAMAVNTQKDHEMASVSFDGNESSVQIANCNILFGGQSAQLSGQVYFSPGYRDVFFSTALDVNSVPYTFSGSVIDGTSLSISGNYGLDATAVLLPGGGANGTFRIDALPFNAGSYLGAVSADTSFSFTAADDWNLVFNRLELSELSNRLPLEPVLTLRGRADSYGCMFESISYSDTVSILNGTGSFMWHLDGRLFDSASASVVLADSLSPESYAANLSVSNPGKKQLKEIDWFRDIYLSVQFSAQDSPAARFFSKQESENTVSAEIAVLGTPENPAVTVNFTQSSVAVGKQAFEFQGIVTLEDGIAGLTAERCAFAGHQLLQPVLSLDLKDFSGTFSAEYAGAVAGKSISAPFEVECRPDGQLLRDDALRLFSIRNVALPEYVLFDVLLQYIDSPFTGRAGPYAASVSKSPGRYDISANNGKIAGFYLTDGLVALQADKSLPVSFALAGSTAGGMLDVLLDDLTVDLSILETLLTIPYAAVSGGTAAGSFHLGGVFSDPELTGSLTGTNVLFTCPEYVSEILCAPVLEVYAEKNRIYFPETVFNSVKYSGKALLSLDLGLDRWAVRLLQIGVKTPANSFLKAQVNLPFMQVTGDGACNLAIEVTPESVFVKGSVGAENAVGILSFGQDATTAAAAQTPDMAVTLDMDITIGQHGQVYFPSRNNPLLRALVTPQTPISVKLDTESGQMDLQGDLVLRGGEITYFRRNFIMREGRLVMNEKMNEFDPRITVRAEMRERDTDGNLIRIILSAQNQLLSEFTPHFSAHPAKSENEIMTILGQNISDHFDDGNIGTQLVAGLLDYGIQTAVFRRVENGLRETLKLDIFSMRTAILQNAMLQYFNSNTGSNKISFSNFIDDSTVYIGKYFGNSLYVDALLHLLYDETKLKSDNSANGLYLQPEIGFEMESPFATIRWNIAPELSPGENCWIPYTSISLSWKFSF